TSFEETRHPFNVIAAALQGSCQLCQFGTDFPSDLGCVFAWIELVGIEPELTKTLLDLWLVQVVQTDLKMSGVWKRHVVSACPGELRIGVDGISDVDNDDEWRAAVLHFLEGQPPDVPFRLGYRSVDGILVAARG